VSVSHNVAASPASPTSAGTRPPEADVRVMTPFLAGGVLGVIRSWLCDEQSSWSPCGLIKALIQCLPARLNTD